MRTLVMRALKMMAALIMSITLLPIRVASVESRWIAGHSLGQKPGANIDHEIDSFVRRRSGGCQNL